MREKGFPLGPLVRYTSSAMWRFRTIALSLLCVLGAGCAEEPSTEVISSSSSSSSGDPEKPTLQVSIDGNPAFLTGNVTVRAEVMPEGSLRGVEFRAGAKAFATDLDAPYAQVFDTTTMPDGVFEIEAIGLLENSVDSITAKREVEAANHPPEVSVLSPIANEMVSGRDPAQLMVSPIVDAKDGNGLTNLYAESDQGPVDLGAGDGTISVPLSGVGQDFPHASVALRIHATDRSGMESITEVAVFPAVTNQEFSLLGGGAVVSKIQALADGHCFIGMNSINGYTPHIYIFAKPPNENPALDAIDGPAKFDVIGQTIAYRRNESVEIRLPDGTAKTLLATSPAAKTYLRFGPVVKTPDRIYAAYFDLNVKASHMFIFDALGNQLVEKVFPLEVLGDEVLILPNGKLLVGMGPLNGASTATLFDPNTLDVVGTWTGNSFRALWADANLVLTSWVQNGPMPMFMLRATAFPSESILFEYPLAQSYITALKRATDGSFLFADVTGDYFRADSANLTTLSSGRFVRWFSGSDDALIVLDPAPMSTEATFQRVKPDGTLVWSKTMTVGIYGSGMTDFDDGGWLWAHGNGYHDASQATILTKVSGSGDVVWERSFAAYQVHAIKRVDDRLWIPYSTGDGSTFVYETVWPQNGETIFRYTEPSCSASYASPSLWPVPAWKTLLGTVVPNDATAMKMIGFVP